jgi:hypothetical protein
MQLFHSGPGLELRHVLESFDWASLGGVIVDVGGNHGTVSQALVDRFPNLRCIVQDRTEVVEEGCLKLAPELAAKVEFMAHDFFTEQPVKDADAYYFRWIFHDWSDKYAIRILRSLIPALKVGARVLINDSVLPEPGSISSYRERKMRSVSFHGTFYDSWLTIK